MLIAGTTGSGKSVIINNLIYHALFDSPQNTSLVLIDPKRVELNKYKGLPHTWIYANDTESIYNALKAVEMEMNRRYEYMEKIGVNLFPGGRILVFIDEYADLVNNDKKRIEPVIRRLGQLARASKIYVILATQYINGIIDTRIRCNFVNRICLHTATAGDSKRVIEKAGAELLPQYGKMIYSIPGVFKIVNVPMITDDQITEMLTYWIPPKVKKPSILDRIKRMF
jgi:S-DNA-T family DNA segregation ATPase FtsK/SpoIIIE